MIIRYLDPWATVPRLELRVHLLPIPPSACRGKPEAQHQLLLFHTLNLSPENPRATL